MAVRQDTRKLCGSSTGFNYPLLVDIHCSWNQFIVYVASRYPWSSTDVVTMTYFNTSKQSFVPLDCDEHLETLFGLNCGSRFGKIHIDVFQALPFKEKEKRGQPSFASANSERPRTPCRSRPSKPTGSESQNTAVADVEEDARPDEAVPRLDDEDELMYPELVDKHSQQAIQDEYMEEPSLPARFDDTDDEEREENGNSLVVDEYDGEDMPSIEWDRENPQLAPGTTFQSMVDCRNAVTTWCILTQNSFVIDKSEPDRFTVHCNYARCRWRLHASRSRKTKLVQVLQFVVYP